MTVLVTGAAGFIGSTLAARLVAEGADVRAIDAFTDNYPAPLKRANLQRIPAGAFALTEGDLATADLAPLLDGVDTVFHLAAQPGVNDSWGAAFATYSRHNIDSTQRLLEHATAAGVRRFVYASSSSVYGDAATFPTLESATPRPFSPYGVSKLAGEHLVTAYADNFGMAADILRFFTVYGPGQRPDMALTRFLTAALTGSRILVNGSGAQVRDFTFVDDVVDALARAARSTTPGVATFNVAGGSSASVNDVLEVIADIHGAELRVDRGPDLPGDVRRTGGSTVAIREALGWEPTVSMRSGIERQYEWLLGAGVGQ